MLSQLETDAFPFAFTERDTPALRLRIASDLQLAVHELRSLDPALRAVVLTGGFSRGEGSTRDGRPINDYDLIALRSRPGGQRAYARAAHALSERVGIEVDVLPTSTGRWTRVPPKLFWLDARLGGRVLWGDPRAVERLPYHAPRDLPHIEVARLLANRAAGLLLALPGPGVRPDLAQRDLQAAKAVLAAMDATLLARGVYDASLRGRLALTREHADHALFARAVEWKLGGSRRSIAWEDAADALLRATDATGARTAPDGWSERGYHALAARRLSAAPSRTIRDVAWALVAASRWPDGPDPAHAKRVLARAGPVGDRSTWPELQARFFELRARTLQ